MSYVFGPLTDDFGTDVTTTSDGAGGLILSCPKYGSLTVTAANLANQTVAMLVQRLEQEEDVYTNWRSLSQALGLPDPGDSQIGSPE
jgi:acetyl-CoA acetyltransferase